MTEAAARALIREHVAFPDYEFHVRFILGAVFLYATYWDVDIKTGKRELQTTRKWYLSPHALAGEIVQTAFKCVLTSMEHRTREGFTYKGRRIFGPQFNLEALVEVCDREGATEERE